MKPIYAIEVYDRPYAWSNSKDLKLLGYYAGTYTAQGAERGKYIAYSEVGMCANLCAIQIFKTQKAAENKVIKLEKIKETNLDLSFMKFIIVQLDEDTANSIIQAKEKQKQSKSNREVIYTGVSINYLKQYLELEQDKLTNMSKHISVHSRGKQEGRIEILQEIINDIEGRN